MIKFRSNGVIIVLLLMLMLVAAGCGKSNSGSNSSSNAPSQDTSPIKVGFSSPLTGGSAKGGQDMLNGAMIAVNEINAAGGVLGRKIELVSEDDGGEPQQAVQAANKLVGKGVSAVIGYYNSGAANACLPVYSKAGMPTILAAVSATNLTQQGFGNIVRIQGHNDQQGQVAAQTMLDKMSAKKIAVIQDNSSYSRGLAESAMKWAKQISPSIVAQLEEITPGEKDFSSVVTKIKALNPDAVYFTGYYAEGSILLKQMRALGIKAQFLAGDANNDPTFIQVAGSDAEGVIFTSPPMVEALPAAAKFIEDYKKQYNIEPGAYAVYSYDGVKLLADAIKRANSTESVALIKALRETKDFSGITSTMSFDEKGDLSKPGYITLKIEKGKFIPY